MLGQSVVGRNHRRTLAGCLSLQESGKQATIGRSTGGRKDDPLSRRDATLEGPGTTLLDYEGGLASKLFFRVSGTFSFDPDLGYVLANRGDTQLFFDPDLIKLCEVAHDEPGNERLDVSTGVWVFKVILTNTIQLAFYRKANSSPIIPD